MMSLAKIEFSPFWRRFICVREILIMDEDIFFPEEPQNCFLFRLCDSASVVDHQYPISITDHLQKAFGEKIWLGKSRECIHGIYGSVLLTLASTLGDEDVSSHH